MPNATPVPVCASWVQYFGQSQLVLGLLPFHSVLRYNSVSLFFSLNYSFNNQNRALRAVKNNMQSDAIVLPTHNYMLCDIRTRFSRQFNPLPAFGLCCDRTI